MKGVKITIDGTHVLGDWEEIDSVSLHGRLPTQYVSSVIDKSSEWDSGDYSAALGRFRVGRQSERVGLVGAG